MKLKKSKVEFFLSIRHANESIMDSQENYQMGQNKNEAIEKITEKAQSVLENAVIQSGQISNYNKIFAVLRHKNKDLWMIIEYRPTFQYDIHSSQPDILDFCQRVGVSVA